jgi:hypothetical protein
MLSTAHHNMVLTLMTVVVELVHPISKVHVDYAGEESAYLLAGYDHEGNEVPADVLEYIALKIGEGGNTRIRMPDINANDAE